MRLAAPQQELIVRGEQIERIYMGFLDKKYIVNRRYQRKLIWTLEEKEKFIDSIISGYPVPIILLAELAGRTDGSLEIIDGMQRLNAITSFIGNEYPVREGYFDLNTVASTKILIDKGILQQKTPVLSREMCVSIASYPVPLSIFEFAQGDAVDEVFRRINSGGRQLSRQELRVAGATNAFAECVRHISARVRGDSSSSDTVVLNDMNKISITNKELPYGINADDVFWIKNGIITKDNLRQSRDEELVSDLLAYMLSDKPVGSRTEFLDDYFGASVPLEGIRAERFSEMDESIRRRNPDLVDIDFQRVHDEIVLMLSQAEMAFSQLLFPHNPGNPVPRYYQAVFLAMHQLIVREIKAVSDRSGLINRLTNSGKHIDVQEGGRWGAENRAAAVKTVVGLISEYFEDDKNPDPATVHWVTKFQNLLTNSKTEQSAYDFKQGFLKLSEEMSFDENSFEKVLETCAAISNLGRGSKGYVIVGVADKPSTASRVETLFGVSSLPYNGFYVTGIEHEAHALHKNTDQLFHDITNRVRFSELSEPLKSYVNSHLKCVKYFDKEVFVFDISGQNQPSLYKDKYFERQGTQVIEVEPARFSTLFARFS